MEVYKFAKKMELEGEEYYKKLADITEDQGLKNIFETLAEDERKHHDIINNIEENFDYCDNIPSIDEEETLFGKELEKVESFDFDKTHIEAYKHAASLERESIDFYEEKKEEAEEQCEKDLFQRLIKEEKKHLQSIQNVIKHLRKPEEWVEDPEFYHMEEY